jgi:hypothetical protein
MNEHQRPWHYLRKKQISKPSAEVPSLNLKRLHNLIKKVELKQMVFLVLGSLGTDATQDQSAGHFLGLGFQHYVLLQDDRTGITNVQVAH